jgi:phosphopantetheine adenylyltransferase
VPSDPALSFISSRYIRDIAANGGDISSMVSASVLGDIVAAFSPRSK